MIATRNEPATEMAGLRASSLADAELDHLERMVQYVTRQAEKVHHRQKLDFEYWQKRLRSLTQTHDLVLSQRTRVFAMLDLLDRELAIRSRPTPA